MESEQIKMSRYLVKELRLFFYFIARSLFIGLIKLIDLFGFAFFSFRKPKLFPLCPKKIIVSDIGHIGDVLFATPVFKILRGLFPDSQIYALIHSSSKDFLGQQPGDFGVITYDHFFISRQQGNSLNKIWRSFKDALKLVRFLKSNKFDLGIDLRHFYPMSILPMALGGVGYIAGYGNRGLGFLLDKQFVLDPSLHEVEQKVFALKQCGLNTPEARGIGLGLYVEKDAVEKVKKMLGEKDVVSLYKYIGIIHPGSGQPSRMWIDREWAFVADFLQSKNIRVVFAGSVSEKKVIRRIMSFMKNKEGCLDLSGQLTLKEFAALVKISDFLIGLESASSHIAAAVHTPVISLYSGTTKTSQWKPWGENVFVVKKDLPCAPCYNLLGCSGMRCLKDIKAQDVIDLFNQRVLNLLNVGK